MGTQSRSIKKGYGTRATRFVALNPYRFMLAVISMVFLLAPAPAFAQNDAGADAGDAGDASLPPPPRPTNPVSDLSQRNRDLRARLETTGHERDQVRTERDAARAERDRVQAELNTCSAERARVTAELANCQLELCRERSRQQLEVTITRVNVIMGRIRAINVRLASIEGRLGTIERNYASLSTQVSQLETTVGQHTTAIESLQQADRNQAEQRRQDLAAQQTRDQAQDVVTGQNTATEADTRRQLGSTNHAVRVIGRVVAGVARLIPVGELGAGAAVAVPLANDGDTLWAARLRVGARWLPADNFYVSLAGHGGLGRVGRLGPGALFGGDLEAGYRSDSGLRIGAFLAVMNAQIFQSYDLSATERVKAGSVGWLIGGGLAVTPRFGERTNLRLAVSLMNGQLGGATASNWYGVFSAEVTFDLNPVDDPARQAREAVENLPEQLPAVPNATPHPRGEAQNQN